MDGASDQNSTSTAQAPGIPAVVQASTTPAPAVVVAAPPVVDQVTTPDPEPAPEPTPEPVAVPAEPTVVDDSSAAPAVSAGLAAIAPVQDDTATVATPVADTPPAITAPMEQSVENEQSAIAAQIESFIDSKTTDTEQASEPELAPAPVVEQPSVSVVPPAEPMPAEAMPAPVAVEVAPIATEFIQPETSEDTAQRIIQPLTDPTASRSLELNALLAQEEEKEKMAEIAKSVVAESEESAKMQVVEPTTQETLPEPAFIETPPAQPIIPHSNGVSMDGVVPPLVTPAPPQPAADTTSDPDNIALSLFVSSVNCLL